MGLVSFKKQYIGSCFHTFVKENIFIECVAYLFSKTEGTGMLIRAISVESVVLVS